MRVLPSGLMAILMFLGNLAGVTAAAVEQAGWSLQSLMHTIATVKNRNDHFTETKELAILDLTLTQEGTLHFQAPDRLSKQILTPEPSSFEIAGNQATIKSAGDPDQVISLEDNPQLRAFSESIRAVLAGDLQALQTHFRTKLKGNAEHWELQLEPLDDLLAMQVDHIEVRGEGSNIRQFIVLENGGDRTVTTLEPTRD